MKKLLSIILWLAILSSATAYADAIAVPSPVQIPDGAYGVWKVTSIKTETPLYEETKDRTSKEIVDAENSGEIRNYGVGRLICDHAGSEVGSGIWHVEDMRVGDTAFLVTEDSTTQYECYMIVTVDYMKYYFAVDGVAQYPHRSSDILCASCSTKPKVEYLGFFKYVGAWG